MGVEYDAYHNAVYICYVHICCWWIFLHAIVVELLV